MSLNNDKLKILSLQMDTNYAEYDLGVQLIYHLVVAKTKMDRIVTITTY